MVNNSLSKCIEVLDKVIKWLKEGKPEAKNLVDFPWEVEKVEDNIYKAIHPMFPVNIFLTCDDSLGILRLQTPLGVETVTLSKDERLLLYHKLLRLNIAPLAKYALMGEDELTVLVDLSIKTLGKKEFNDALAMHLASINAIIKELGLEKEYQTQLFLQLLGLVRKHLEEGWGREKLIDYLVRYAGLKREQAIEIVNSILKETSSEETIYT
jgi:hypothetical protein